jgi:membrane-bound lytic murein transglycosylase A
LGTVHHTIATAIASTATISRKTHNKFGTSSVTSPAHYCALSVAALLLASCAAVPDKQIVQVPQPQACPPPVEPPACPPPPVVTPPPPTPSAPVETDYRGRLQPASWADIPEWRRDPVKPALQPFLRSCSVLEKQDAWKTACAAASAIPASASEHDVVTYFENHFIPHQVVNADETTTGMVTGYYEPLLRGSRKPSKRYRFPIYAVPSDLLVIDLSSVYPELKHRRLRGRIEGNRVVPYLARGDIDREPAPLKGRELVWVDDAVDLFFLHIQGSGQVELESGERMRVGYAEQNGHPFKSLGGLLVRSGELPLERASMQGIKDWARRNPNRIQAFMNANPSYVFFRELAPDLPGPIGSLGVPLTAERSIAVDPRVVPLGVPVFLSTTWPNSPQPLNRMVIAQDTGGAIAGGVRVDYFWGFGDAAGALAGRMKQTGRMWVLLPKGYAPPQPPAPRS